MYILINSLYGFLSPFAMVCAPRWWRRRKKELGPGSPGTFVYHVLGGYVVYPAPQFFMSAWLPTLPSVSLLHFSLSRQYRSPGCPCLSFLSRQLLAYLHPVAHLIQYHSTSPVAMTPRLPGLTMYKSRAGVAARKTRRWLNALPFFSLGGTRKGEGQRVPGEVN